jgi:hypothetical protein
MPARTLMIGLPVIGFLILICVFAWSLTSGLDLKGELTARRLSGASLPESVISWTDTGLNDDDRSQLMAFLGKTPEVLTSRLVSCRISATDEGLTVRLTAGRNSEWYVVETTSEAGLALWLKGEGDRMNGLRLKGLRETLAAWCRDKLAQAQGQAIAVDAAAVRDDVGFACGGGALSFVTSAVVEGQAVPAAAQDNRGALLFCLPKQTQAFEVTGRVLPDGSQPFSGTYSVKVSGDPVTVESPTNAASEPAASDGAPDDPPGKGDAAGDAADSPAGDAAMPESGDAEPVAPAMKPDE